LPFGKVESIFRTCWRCHRRWSRTVEVTRPITEEIVMSSKSVEFHLIDTGHFALEDKADEMVPLIRDFLGRKVARK
jgi:hypothetical protein